MSNPRECPHCGYYQTKVTDSRASGDYWWRRRECHKCGQRHTTVEVLLDEYKELERKANRNPKGYDSLAREVANLGACVTQLRRQMGD